MEWPDEASIFRIAAAHLGSHSARIVNAKKKAAGIPATPTPAKGRMLRTIRLHPTTSDYETFAKTTALAMGKTTKAASASKPNTRLLSLLNLGS